MGLMRTLVRVLGSSVTFHVISGMFSFLFFCCAIRVFSFSWYTVTFWHKRVFEKPPCRCSHKEKETKVHCGGKEQDFSDRIHSQGEVPFPSACGSIS